jgi:CheY-like chemotaxis protein
MKKILLIEDEEVLISLIEKKLTQTGYEIFVARNGLEGMEKMREMKPDLILLDILMPKMDGMEVLEAMQKDEALREIPIIVISNSGQPVEIDKIRELGARDWLVKAEFNPQEVVEKIKKQIG